MSNTNFVRYDAYKDSGVEWLGEVPEHWGVKRLKDISPKITTGATPSEELFVESGFKWYTPGDFNDHIVLEQARKEVIGKPKTKIYPANSILIVSIGATLGKIGIAKNSFSANQQINIVYPSHFYFPFYLLYFLSASTDSMKAASNASTLGIMNQSKTGQLLVFIPPLQEQTAIAAYLDTKTAQIDRKIDLLTQKATQYGKLKQSLINETVTRGLDKTVAMKDSGVEWIGEVPEHWQVKRGKDVFEQTKNKAGIESSSYDVLSLTLKGVIKRDLDNMKGKIPASFDGYQIANPDNLVLCLFDMDVTPRIVGYVEQLGIITSAYTVLKGKYDTHMKYFLYYYLEQNRNGSLLSNSKTLRSTMTFDLFSQLRLPVPSLTEQKAIANYLDTKTAHIDRIIETINTQIAKLKELRKTLINDVVTGKIKVTG